MDNYAAGGRRRAPSNHSIEDSALDDLSKEAENKLAARRQARAEAREIRMREIERQQKEAEENADKIFDIHNSVDSTSRLRNSCMSRNISMISSPHDNNSRRNSEDSVEDNYNYRDGRQEVKELEEKFRKAMIQNAQLDNEKSAISYQVELYKDKYQDLEATFTVLQKEHKDKCREHEQLKRLVIKQKDDLSFFRSQIEERDKLIEENGLLVIANEGEDNELQNSYHNKDITNGDKLDHIEYKRKLSNRMLISTQSAELLNTVGEGSLDNVLKKCAQERNELMDIISNLKSELEEERIKSSSNCYDLTNGGSGDFDGTKETSKLVGDYKFKWQKAEQDISTLQANVARLESQVIRYKSAAETSEKVEDELKTEKRKLHRELREALSRVDDLETTNNHLQKRLDKLKNAKSTLLKEI